jgi:hypothetical protein
MFNAAMFTFGHVAAACIAKAIAPYRGSILATGDMYKIICVALKADHRGLALPPTRRQ